MPLYRVLAVLFALDIALLAVAAAVGITLDGREAMLLHFKLGLLGSAFTCFLHVLVLFYLIGTGKDIRDAVEDFEDLRARFVPWTRAQKRRAFPPACFAIVLLIVATLMGGEVHSRVLVLARDGGATLPFRGVSAWWVHGFLVICAVLASLFAFYAELLTVRENRRGIDEINRELDARARQRAGIRS